MVFIGKYDEIGQLVAKTIVCTDVQPVFTYFFQKVAIDGWKCVMKLMRFSLELHVNDLVRVICDARLICSEFHL